MTGTRSVGARTPEELEALFEDALLIHDYQTLAALFEEGAVLGVGNDQCVCGSMSIAKLALSLWDGDQSYVAAPQRVIQARDIALIVAERAVNVARRGSDGAWRYAVALVRFEEVTARLKS